MFSSTVPLLSGFIFFIFIFFTLGGYLLCANTRRLCNCKNSSSGINRCLWKCLSLKCMRLRHCHSEYVFVSLWFFILRACGVFVFTVFMCVCASLRVVYVRVHIGMCFLCLSLVFQLLLCYPRFQYNMQVVTFCLISLFLHE